MNVPTHAGETTSIEMFILHDEWIEAHKSQGDYAAYQRLYKMWIMPLHNQITIRQSSQSFCMPKWWRAIVKE